MAWSFRRSQKFGPFRLNLSKSGIGYSLGIPGFRVGKSARGSLYRSASIPGTGIYNRTYFSDSQAKQTGQANPGNVTVPQTWLAPPPFKVQLEQMLTALTDEQKQWFHARYDPKQKDRKKMLWISVLLGWFRHTFRSWLDAVGTAVGVQQQMMWHADVATTMNIYGKGMRDSKLTAHTKLLEYAGVGICGVEADQNRCK